LSSSLKKEVVQQLHVIQYKNNEKEPSVLLKSFYLINRKKNDCARMMEYFFVNERQTGYLAIECLQ
jgi:hypothetical protein